MKPFLPVMLSMPELQICPVIILFKALVVVNYKRIVKLMNALLPNRRVLFHQHFPLRTGILK